MAKVVLGKKGRNNILGFFTIMGKILKDKKINFDLVIGAGDSGVAMVKLTEMVYGKLKLKMPASIIVPFFRYTKKDVPRGIKADNLTLVPWVKRKLTARKKIRRVLFVDDDIANGRTLTGVIKLLRKAKPRLFDKETTIYIVAEDRGRPLKFKLGMKIKLIPFAQKIVGVSNAISYAIPYELELPIKEKYPDTIHGSKERMNVLLSLPVKQMFKGIPHWSNRWQKQLSREIPKFEKLQQKFSEYLYSLMEEVI